MNNPAGAWERMPAIPRAALAWSFLRNGPSTAEDLARLHDGFTYGERGPIALAVHEEARWMGHCLEKAVSEALCLFPIQKFSSDTERVLAVVLENERENLKWVKPTRGQYQIHYRYQREEHQYEPNFVVETATDKFLLEPKMASQVEDAKGNAEAARTWCEAASGHARTNGGKPWTYVLIRHDAITENMTLKWLVATYA